MFHIQIEKNIKLETKVETSKIIEILKLPPEKRTFDNIFLMKKYLHNKNRKYI